MLRKLRFRGKNCFLIKNTRITVYNYMSFIQNLQYKSKIKKKGIKNP